MFIELHDTDGEPFLLNVDAIESLRPNGDESTYIYFRGNDFGKFVIQESYEDICRALPGEITLVGTQSELKGCRFVKTSHKCSSCGHAWTGYYDVCPKCGTLDVSF